MSTNNSRASSLASVVASLAPGDRSARLDRECAGDAALRAEVESMLDDSAPTIVTHVGPRSKGGAPIEPTVVTGGGATVTSKPGGRDLRHKTIGPYRVIHELGQGGMGVVYLAEREGDQFKRRVALKLLKRGMDTEDVLRRFELERQLLASLNHPGISRLYDAGETEDGLPYFAMEYVEGMPIDSYCDVHRLHITERLELFQKVCAAVHHAHQSLVVHRDLKPANILVSKDGQPKLLDFGIAKLIHPEFAALAGDPTAPDMRVMTPEYASPEQVRGAPITTASDVYSLGVLLYELVCGHAPYKLHTKVRAELERVICDEEPERPSTAISRAGRIGDDTSDTTAESVSRTREGRPERLRRRLVGDIDNIVLMAMRKEPQRRYQSAEQLAEDIRRHMDGMPVIARPDTLSYRVSKFVRRNRMGVGAAALITFSLVGGLVGTASARNSAQNGWDAEAKQRQIAVEQRDRAERRFEEVRSLARTLMYDVHDAVQELDGSVGARTLLVSAAQEYLEGLAEDVGDNVDLRRDLAASYQRVGDIRGGIRNPSLGDVDGALQNYQTALGMREQLVQDQPGHEEIQRELSDSQIRVADVYLLRGRSTDALAMHRASFEICESLLEASPDDETAQRDLAIALGNVGAALIAIGDTDDAIEKYDRSLEIRRAIVAEHGDDPKVQRELSVACLRVGGRLQEAGRYEDALAMYGEAATIRQRLVDSDAFNSRWRRDLAVAKYFVGETSLEMGRPDAALKPVQHFLDVSKQGMEASPLNARVKRDVANGHELIGRVHLALGDQDEAMRHFRRCQAVTHPLAAADRDNLQYRELIARSHERMGEVLAARADWAAAVHNAEMALPIAEMLLEKDPADTRRPALQARIERKLGTWLVELDRIDEARRYLHHARDTYLELRKRNPGSVVYREELARTLQALSRLMVRLDDAVAAVEYAEEAAALGPPDALVLRDLARAYSITGNQTRAAEVVRSAIDLIESNPPYDADAERDQLDEDLRTYEG